MMNPMLETLSSVGQGPAAVIVRHAERHHILSITDSLKVGLTERGREDARLLGRSLEGYRLVRVFHSPAVRCRETAELIIEGLAGNGTSVAGPTETWALCAPYLKDERVLKQADDLGQRFMRAWHDGRFDPEFIERTPRAADMVLGPMVERLRDPDGHGRLDVHVSHDWEIVLLREELLGLRHEEVGWAGYLEGVVLSLDGDEVVAISNGTSRRFRFDGSGRLP